MIDRNVRARLGARIRADRRLSPTARLVGQAALFSAMDASTGRCQAYRARLAHEAGCSKRSVTRATLALQDAGYLSVVPTWGKRHRSDGRRWFRPRVLPVVRTRASLARSSIVIHVGIPAGQIRSLPVIRFIPGLIRTPARPSMALDHRVAM